jgi:hypothetical protein
MFVPEHRYVLTEYDPQMPWIVVATARHLTVDLGPGESFAEWAGERWPSPRFRAELEPDELLPWQGAG